MVVIASIDESSSRNTLYMNASLEEQLDHGISVASVDALLAVRLSEAIKNDDLGVVKKALQNTPISEYRSQFGSILHLAASFSSTKTFAELVAEGIDINCQNAEGQTALHIASRLGRQEIAEMLLSRDDVDDTIRDKDGRTPLEIAKSRQIASVFEYARNIHVIRKSKEMHSFAHRGDFESLKELFDIPRNQVLLDINALDANGNTVLHTSARLGNYHLVQLALALGADPFIKNRKGKIPLEVCKDEAVKCLLKEAPMVNTNDTIIKGKKTRVEGFLGKWTNYAEGYRRRWFVLEDGILSYYKSQVEYPVSCRGSLNLQFAQVLPHSHDRLRFEVIGVNSTMRYHLRADNAADAKRWVIAITQAQMALSTDVSPKTGVPIVGAGTGSPDWAFHLTEGEFEKNGKEVISGLFTNLESLEVLFVQFVEGSMSKEDARMTLVPIMHNLKEMLGSMEDRESVWRQKLEAETLQRQLFEDSLRAVALENHKLELFTRRKLKNSPSSAQELEEFYDALESQSMISESDEEEEYSEPENELKLAKFKVSDKKEDFIHDELVGYPAKFRNLLPADSSTMPPVNLWSIIKNMMGKDLFRIPLPVNFSEPVSMLQRLCEDMEYSELLDEAAASDDPVRKFLLVAAFAVSGYSSTDGRVTKPFNPLLGETFEYVSREKGLRYIAEQVSHHPPISACHAETAEWIYYGDANVKNKLSGQSLELIPEGYTHVIFKRTGEHFNWKRVKTVIYNLIVGKLWIDHCGTMSIQNSNAPDWKCTVEFEKASWTTCKNVKIQVIDPSNQEQASVKGKWNTELGELWRRHHLTAASTHMYKFTNFTMTLNELGEGMKDKICPTDSRLRPDQRAMEEGRFEEANELKVKLEEKQRVARKLLTGGEYEPRWFKKERDELTGVDAWMFTGEYWKGRGNDRPWDRVPSIFLLE